MARADVVWDDGTRELFILRGDPPPAETLITSDRDAEWRLLRALHDAGALAVPEPRFYEGAEEHLGTKCIVMEAVGAPTLQRLLDEADDAAQFTDGFVDAMAKVHSVALDVLPDHMARPASWDEYMDARIGVWSATDATLPDSNPVLRYVAAWLRAHRPPPCPLVLVHGDFQPSNVLLHEERGHVFVDWEFARVGDPREDLGYYLTYANVIGPDLYTPDPEAFLARYRAQTGLTAEQVNPATVGYFSLISTISTISTIMQSVAGMGLGEQGGTMVTYNINAVSYLEDQWLALCDKLGAAIPLTGGRR
jgi:aminoglycoside phosphotransferase (APT) family kinase protein